MWAEDRQDAYCELRFSPNQGLVATVRRFVGEFYEHILGDPVLTSRMVVATHELLENVVRYAADGQSGIRIGVHRAPDGLHVVVDTYNRATAEHRAALMALLEEMGTAQDRDGFYLTLMRRSAKRRVGSGLGLGRIFAEAEMDLSLRSEDDDFVRLRAEARLPPREPKA